jgi:predicted amidophosphoribosyltransferase
MIASLRPMLDRFEQFVFPPACWSCGAGRSRPWNGGICAACWNALPLAAGTRCGRCDLPIAAPGAAQLEDPRCGRCLADPPAFDSLRCPAIYAGVAREVLKAFKYRRADYLAPRLSMFMAAVFPDPPEDAVFTAVPATRRERRDRGFFPAGALAAELAFWKRRPYRQAILEKTRETERQAGLPLADRAENVRGAFRARFAARTVLLIDDVATSGATLSACARALRLQGAERVDAVAFARALPEAP